MGLEKCGLNLNAAQRELKSHGTLEFPCAGYLEEHQEQASDNVPWHWHNDLEIIYIESGRLTVQIPSMSFTLQKGDCLAINSGILHSAKAAPKCTLCSLVFDPLLLTGSADSVFAKKYITPLTTLHSFRAYLLDQKRNAEEAAAFLAAFQALSLDAPGYEFIVREKLSAFCFMLYKTYADALTDKTSLPDLDNMRLQKMLAYIEEHYAEQIVLEDIAGAADIGERECLRCFKRTIQLSPVQYTVKYRIMQGAALLKEHPADSVSEIALSCGFDSPSYFAKTFHKFLGCSPKEYRQSTSDL